MRIFVKKAYEFKNRQTGETLKVSPLMFADAPDWIKADPLFKWAQEDKNLEVVGNGGKVAADKAAADKQAKA